MSNACPEEQSVLKGSAGPCDEPLVAHVRACPACADTARVARWLRTSEVGAAGDPLPSPDAILRRARLLQSLWRDQDPDERAERRAVAVALLPLALAAPAALGWAVVTFFRLTGSALAVGPDPLSTFDVPPALALLVASPILLALLALGAIPFASARE